MELQRIGKDTAHCLYRNSFTLIYQISSNRYRTLPALSSTQAFTLKALLLSNKHHTSLCGTYKKIVIVLQLNFIRIQMVTVRLKLGLSPSEKICVVWFVESHVKMMKNVFYFILKAVFDLKIYKILSWLFGHVEKTSWLAR